MAKSEQNTTQEIIPNASAEATSESAPETSTQPVLYALTTSPNASTTYRRDPISVADILLYFTALFLPVFPVLVITGFSKELLYTFLLSVAGFPYLLGLPGTIYAVIVIRRYRGPNAVADNTNTAQDGSYQRLNSRDVEAQHDEIALGPVLPPSYDETVAAPRDTKK